jgi:hypothetical protein
MIKLALDLYGQATLGCSKIATVLNVVFGGIIERTPHRITVRNWCIRNGLHSLEKPIEKSDDMVAIGDITISLGKVKCLAILGTRAGKLKQREDYTLNHQDVEVLGLHVTEKATGDFVQQSFEETRNRMGFDFLGVVIDQGAEMKKGCRQYQKDHANTIVIHDIKHKMSLVMEHTLRKNFVWIEFNKKMLETRRLIQQTEFAAMTPPTQRSKARFMDIGYILHWRKRVLKAKQSGHLDCISNERYEKYFGWLKEYEQAFEDWDFMEGAVDMVNSVCREYGLSHETYEYLKINFEEAFSVEDENLIKFLKEALKSVEEESCKLKPGQVMLCSTEVEESIFGKFKELNTGSQEIGSNILGLATFVGPKLTEKSIKEAMENCSTKKGLEWIKQKIGETLGSIRNRIFRGNKETKFDIDFSECVVS